MDGIKNNIYDFKTENDSLGHKIQRVEETLFKTKKGWFD